MKLYEFGPTRSIRVRWTLQELGVPFEAVSVNLMTGENRSPDFLKLNPAGKLPVLVDGNLVLTESVAIVRYLAEKYPEQGLIPRDPIARAEFDRWIMFAVTELEQPLWRISRHTAIYPPDKRLPAEIDLARADFTAMAAILEAHMQGRDFVVGKSVTAADFILGYTLDWGQTAKLLGGFPALEAYVARMYARPAAPLHIAEALARAREAAATAR